MKNASMLAILALTACGRGGEVSDYASPSDPLVRDAIITKLTFNQGVSHILRDTRYGKPFGQPDVIQDRSGVLRVFLDVDEDAWEERQVIAVVDINGVRGFDRFVHSMTVSGDSVQSDEDTTFDIEIPADLVHPGSFFTVSLHESDPAFEGDPTNEEAFFDVREEPWEVRETGHVTVRVIPVHYTAGGADLKPDTSPEQIARIADTLRGMYPASTLTVEVGEPLPWGSTIGPTGAGWQTLLGTIADMRVAESDLPESTYFYGLFRATETEEQWCAGGGCILGLSNFGTLNDTETRSSIGIGYTGPTTADTLAHEVGHAHGRAHAPCGQGVSNIDPGYPHSNAALGTWGWDPASGDLIDPLDHHDMMGYCSPIWVSDYTWHHLSERIAALNTPATMSYAITTPRHWQQFAVGPDGEIDRIAQPRLRHRAPVGEPRKVTIEDASGTRTVEGRWFPASHVRGGMLMLESGEEWPADAKVHLD